MATLYEPDVDDMNGFQGVFSSQNYRDVIKVDEQKFTYPKRVEFLFSEETPITGCLASPRRRVRGLF